MPRVPKIIPGYTHAHVATYINDNSGVRPLEMPARPSVDTSMKTLCVFGADKGPDNVLRYIPPRQWVRFQNYYGIPNFNKYGQASLHPYLFLNNNPNTGVWAMRVLPDDAAYANGIVVAHFGVQDIVTLVPDGEGGTKESTEKRFQIMYTVENYLPKERDLGCLTDYGEFNSLDGAAKEWRRVAPESPDENGWYTLPIAAIRPIGHGKYGNKYSFRFERDLSAERDTDMKMYRLSILDSFQATVYKSSYRGSLINSTIGKPVTSIQDVIVEKDDDANISTILYPDNVAYIFDEYKKFLDTIKRNEIIDPKEVKIFDASVNLIVDQFDPIFGYFVGNTTNAYKLDIIDEPLPMYNDQNTPDPRYKNARNLKEGAGQKLDGGTDGSFDKPPVGKTFQEVYDEELVYAFTASKDQRISDTSRVKIDFIMDANYTYSPNSDSTNVKGAMYKLNNYRCRNKFDVPDTGAGSLLFLDAGQQYTDITSQIGSNNRVDPSWQFEMNSELLNLTQSFTTFDNRITSKEFQHGTVYDPFTNKRIVVTSTWNLARNYIPMLQRLDIMTPFAGKANAVWDDIIPGTLYPALTSMDMDVKEELERQRFNYYQYDGGAEIGTEQVVRMSQNTCQMDKTSLTNENNMVVLNFYVKGVEDFCRGKMWTFNDPIAQKSFTDELNARYEGWVGVKCTSLRTYFTADVEDMEHDILRCFSEIVFRNLVKVIVHEVDISRLSALGNEDSIV